MSVSHLSQSGQASSFSLLGSTPATAHPLILTTDSTEAAELASTFGDLIAVGKVTELKDGASKLLLLARQTSPKDPSLVVTHILNAFAGGLAKAPNIEALQGLAEALHAYADLIHLVGGNDLVDASWKQTADSTLTNLVSLIRTDVLGENSLRYALKSAKAGINALTDNQENQRLFNFIISIVQGAYNSDVGGLLSTLSQLIQESKKAQAAHWYADLLLIRLLTPLAVENDAIFQQIIDMKSLHSSWKYQCGYLKALSTILQQNPSSKQAKNALEIVLKASSLHHWRDKEDWRIRETACEELIYLTRTKAFEEDAIHTLVQRSKVEKKDPVKLRISSSIATLKTKDDWNKILFTLKNKEELQTNYKELEQQKEAIEEEKKRLADLRDENGINESDYNNKIQALEEVEKELDEEKEAAEDLLAVIKATVERIEEMLSGMTKDRAKIAAATDRLLADKQPLQPSQQIVVDALSKELSILKSVFSIQEEGEKEVGLVKFTESFSEQKR